MKKYGMKTTKKRKLQKGRGDNIKKITEKRWYRETQNRNQLIDKTRGLCNYVLSELQSC